MCERDLVRQRPVLDELNEFIFENNRPGCHGEIATDFECLLVGHRNSSLADVLEQISDAERHTVAAGLHCTLKGMRVGGEIIRWTHGVEDLPGEKTQPSACLLINDGAFDEIVHVSGINQIHVLQKIMVGALFPLIAGKAPIRFVSLLRSGCGRHQRVHPYRAHFRKVILLHRGHFGET
jgi:hypothetical protein